MRNLVLAKAIECADAWCSYWQEFAYQADRWHSLAGYQRAQLMWKSWY
jgi:hypothetical protein